MADLGIELDPKKDLPADYRKLVRLAAWFLVSLSAGFAVGAAAAEMTVGRRLEAHEALQSDLPAVLEQMDKKLDALCRATPTASCPLGRKE